MPPNAPSAAPVLSMKEKLGGLPTKEQAFGSAQRIDNARGLPGPEMYKLKLEIEALAAKHNLRVNDVLDHYGLHRHTYWYFIDVAKPVAQPPAKKERNRERTSVSDLPAADQLALLMRVDRMTSPIGDNMDLHIACLEAGITTAQYYAMDHRRAELRAKAAESNIDDLGITPVTKPPEIADDAVRLRVHDAATILSLVTRQRMDQAARMLGIEVGDLSAWRTQLGVEPVIAGNSGQNLPLSRDRLQFDDAGKVRMVHGLRYLRGAVGADELTVAKTLGIHRQSVEAWFRNLEKMETALAAAAEARQRQATAMGVTALPAAEMLPAPDADTLQLHGRLECANAADMHPTRLVGLWRAAKGRGADNGAMNELLTYYVPVLDMAIARYRGNDMAHRVDEGMLRGYAHPGLWQAVREYRLSDTRPFVPFATAMAATALRAELRGDGMTQDIARSAFARLQNARRRWLSRASNRRLERMPSPEELAQIMHISVWEVCDLIEVTERVTVSLQTKVGENGDGELGLLLEDQTVLPPDADEGMASNAPTGLDGEVWALVDDLPEDRRRFMEAFYLNGSMPEACALLRISEAAGWALHHNIVLGLRRRAAALPAFTRFQRRFEQYGDGRPTGNGVVEAMTVDFPTVAEFAPQLIEHATRWVPYALMRMDRGELLAALEDEYADHALMDEGVILPEVDNRAAFYRVALLVLRAEEGSAA